MLKLNQHCRSCVFWRFNLDTLGKPVELQGGWCHQGIKQVIVAPGDPKLDLKSGSMVPTFNLQTVWPYLNPNEGCGFHEPDGVTVERADPITHEDLAGFVVQITGAPA